MNDTNPIALIDDAFDIRKATLALIVSCSLDKEIYTQDVINSLEKLYDASLDVEFALHKAIRDNLCDAVQDKEVDNG